MSTFEKGRAKMHEILGEKADLIIESLKELSPEFADYIVKFAYGDIYTRQVLPDKQKELAAVSCLIGMGLTGVPLKTHIYGMINTGWTKEEIIESLIFLTAYAGFPVIVEALNTAKEIFEVKPSRS